MKRSMCWASEREGKGRMIGIASAVRATETQRLKGNDRTEGFLTMTKPG